MSPARERTARSAGLLGMRRAILLLTLAGCVGGLNNQPLEQGVVSGQLTGEGSAGAQVFAFGHPELAVRAAADGTFKLEHVPVGHFRVVASGDHTALALEGDLAPGQSRQVGTQGMAAAGAFNVKVNKDDAQVLGARILIDQTPLTAQTDASGSASLPALPPGCYDVQVALPSGETSTRQACLTTEDAEVEFEFGQPSESDAGLADAGHDDHDAGSDLDAGHDVDGGHGEDAGSGCLATGCNNGLQCDPGSGQCVQCLGDSDCGGSGWCYQHSCVNPTCGSCTYDQDCGPGGACLQFFDGGASTCSYACTNDYQCAQIFGYGYTCESNRCQPRLDEISACEAASELDANCQTSTDCRNAGLVNGFCGPDGSCSVLCSSDSDCPGGWTCYTPDAGDRFCVQ